MDVILIPGLWLDASSWDAVLPPLREAGHRPHPLTMPGIGASRDESSSIGIDTWVGAVVDEIDRSAGDVVLVGHSGGGNVAWGAAAERPGRVRRVIFVDTLPPPPGSEISPFEVVDGVIPFPGWESFDDEDVDDLDAETRAATAPRMRSVPARVPTDAIELRDEQRFGIPVTLLMGRLDEAALRGLVPQWGAFGDEFAAIDDIEVVRLDTAHWPQFSQPERFAAALVAAVR